MGRPGHRLATILALTTIVAGALPLAAGGPKPPEIPARVAVEVGPAGPGDTAPVVVRLTPVDGVKLNRYPKISLDVEALDGVVGEASVRVGSEMPPRPGSDVSNYWNGDSVPVELALPVDRGAPSGEHRVAGRLLYYYCVIESGFCSRKAVDVVIPLAVR